MGKPILKPQNKQQPDAPAQATAITEGKRLIPKIEAKYLAQLNEGRRNDIILIKESKKSE